MSTLITWSERLFLSLLLVFIPATVLLKAAPNLLGVGIILSVVSYLLATRSPLISRPIALPFYILGLFLMWAIISSVWSLDPQTSLVSSLKITATLLSGFALYTYLERTDLDRIMKRLLTGIFIGLALVFVELKTQGFLYQFLNTKLFNPAFYNHGLSLILLLVWPLIAYLIPRSKPILVVLLALAASSFYASVFHASIVAFAGGLVSWGIAYKWPRFFLRTASILSFIIIMGTPWLIHHYSFEQIITSSQKLLMKESYHHRIAILKRTSDMIAEKPLLGHGINTFSQNYKTSTVPHANIEILNQYRPIPFTQEELAFFHAATHPHDLTMQLWYEMGIIGAFLFALFLSAILWYASLREYSTIARASLCGFFAACFILTHISFSAWQSWWLFGFILSLGILIKQLRVRDKV